jgi:hypothetical protein
MVHYVGSIIGMHSTFTQKGFDQAIKIIKVQCIIVWYVNSWIRVEVSTSWIDECS